MRCTGTHFLPVPESGILQCHREQADMAFIFAMHASMTLLVSTLVFVGGGIFLVATVSH